MAINLRSPYYLEIEDDEMDYSILELYIWEWCLEDEPLLPQYVLKKYVITKDNNTIYEISELIKDYLDITFEDTYNDNQVLYVKN